MSDEPTPLADAIAAFLAHTGMSAITFGRRAVNDPHFVRQLQAGRRVWPETEAKVRNFMKASDEPASSASTPDAQAAA